MEIIPLIVQLLILILKEYFSARSKAKEERREFKLDQTAWAVIVKNALAKMRADAGNDSAQAGHVEDQVDEDLKNRGNNGAS